MEGFCMTKLKSYWLDFFQEENHDHNWWVRKKELNKERQADIVRINGTAHVFSKKKYDREVKYQYLVHLIFLIKQNDFLYKEEQIIPYQFRVVNSQLKDHHELILPQEEILHSSLIREKSAVSTNIRFDYNRRAAVSYAEHWWNSYNPKFRKFDVDCTNYISQCLLAGGATMHGAPNRSAGWWYQQSNWSFSWAVAHSLRWYLSGATKGLTGKEVDQASDLKPGDVICYDFEGDGRWDHNTIVVAFDANGMPLVNAHTNNSRHRYWSYEDSAAWTPEIKYKFFQIG